MGEVLLLLVVALTVAAVVFGVTVLISGRDPGLAPAEPDGRAVPLPGSRPLRESDVAEVRFDTALRGYRMAQVDQAMRRAAYDIGYKSELIGVLEAEVAALREGRTEEAETLRRAREEAAGTAATAAPAAASRERPAGPVGPAPDGPAADAPAHALTAEAGVAEAPAAAAVEDEATLPTTDARPTTDAEPTTARPTTGGEVAPAAAVEQPATDVPLRPPAESTAAPVASPGAAEADESDDRDRGQVVRSESA
ncbi:DivIVA domain-containing protein [Micromonospora sp. NBC_00898]|uniref:DivIVA domain-containing protein n=1 Tax=Micromonospora sp. NBC_00898 TaxID=2975981 RepID=UPI00386D1B41|nr:DivIVA domain-containing protein [Micromonospora sp. NBC_00898]